MLIKDRLLSHIKPLKYKNNDGVYIGKYIVNLSDITFIPDSKVSVFQAIEASITISNKYKKIVYMTFNNTPVSIPYQTNLSVIGIQHIANIYFDRLYGRIKYKRGKNVRVK